MGTGRLQLLPNAIRPDDYLVMGGAERVGRIYKRSGSHPGDEWLWAINRAHYAEWADIQLAGRTGSLEQATSELKQNWKRVQAAGLR
jgi:hypothetical protein